MVDKSILFGMREQMISRGPDDAGIWINRQIGLAHRRLSILDVSQLGHQPMIDNCKGNVIVFNGEVYNFQEIRSELIGKGVDFTSNTDTEVILKAYRIWGRACVEKFNGILIPGGFGTRGSEGIIKTANFAREKNVPYLGICFGFQLAAVAFGRHVCNMENGNSTEIDSETKYPIIEV